MDGKISVLLVDDHAVLSDGLAAKINAEPDMRTAGICGNAEQAVSAVIQSRPQVVLMDIEMPGLDSFAACRTILAQVPETKIIFLSAFANDSFIQRALELRAWGFITKSESFSCVCDAIRGVVSGRVVFSDDVKSRLVAGKSGYELGGTIQPRLATLSRRELEVLGYLAQGLAVKEVAKVMHLSPKTVDNHKSKIMAKLDIHDRVELARFAIREGVAVV